MVSSGCPTTTVHDPPTPPAMKSLIPDDGFADMVINVPVWVTSAPIERREGANSTATPLRSSLVAARCSQVGEGVAGEGRQPLWCQIPIKLTKDEYNIIQCYHEEVVLRHVCVQITETTCHFHKTNSSHPTHYGRSHGSCECIKEKRKKCDSKYNLLLSQNNSTAVYVHRYWVSLGLSFGWRMWGRG